MPADRIDDNASCWLDETAPYEPGPALSGDVQGDVAIVGGGLTGVSTAFHLSERFPNLRIVLLEARSLANGASGRNGGQVLNGINGIEPRDEALAVRVHRATSAGIDIVEHLASRSSLDAGFVRSGCLEVATTTRSAEGAQARVERARSWGIPLRWLPASVAGLHGACGAVLDPGAARVNAAALVRGLRGVLTGRGVEIHENSPVLAIDEGPVVALTVGSASGVRGVVRANALVLATNAYTPDLGYFRSGILPMHSHVVATAPLPAERWQAMGWSGHEGFSDDLDRIAYGCRTPGGRLLFGGGGNAAYSYSLGGSPALREAPVAAYAAIEKRVRDYFPAAFAAGASASSVLPHRWSGPLAITFDRVCSMGLGGGRTGRARNIYYALGYSGHGLALAALAGRVLTDLYAGDEERWRELPFYQRPLPYIPPDPFRWVGYQVYTRLTGRSPRAH